MDTLLAYGLPIILGFALGKFLQKPVLQLITLISLAISVYMVMTAREMELLIALSYSIIAVVANVAMWVTWYCTSTQTSIGDFVRKNILR